MIKDHKFEINYLFRNQPMVEVFDAEQETMSQEQATYRLLQKHRAEFAQGAIPAEDARAEDILHFARDNALTDVRVSKVHAHPKGDTPAHYKQP